MKFTHALQLTTAEVVAFVGGGGKTTAMFRLADELAAMGRRVLTSTSTRIFTTQINESPAHLTVDSSQDSLADLIRRLNHALDQHGQALITGSTDAAQTKTYGLPLAVIDALAESGQFDAIIVEADGSRHRPFKAPADHEPVIPSTTTVVVPVVGVDVLGQPLHEPHVHRPHLISQISRLSIGAPITAETVATVIGHPQGGLKNVPSGARVTPLLNKIDLLNPSGEFVEPDFDDSLTQRSEQVEQTIAAMLRQPRLEAVLVGAVQQAESPIRARHNRVGAVILAAGRAGRFGSPKQLAMWNGRTFLERAVETALATSVSEVVVVLGAEVAQCQAIVQPYPVKVVINEAWAAGQSTSMQAGLRALSADIGAAMFMLVDLPNMTPPIVEAVLDRYRETAAPLVWPEFAGRRGNPVLFDRRLFPELHQIRGDTGGKPVLQAYRQQAARVLVSESAILQDVDTPADLAALRRGGGHSESGG